MSLAVAAMAAASGCSNCGTPACAPAPAECVNVGCGPDNVAYRPDLYAASCQNPEVAQKTRLVATSK